MNLNERVPSPKEKNPENHCIKVSLTNLDLPALFGFWPKLSLEEAKSFTAHL